MMHLDHTFEQHTNLSLAARDFFSNWLEPPQLPGIFVMKAVCSPLVCRLIQEVELIGQSKDAACIGPDFRYDVCLNS